MRYLTLAEVVAIHEAMMRGFGQPPNPVRDEGALESAITRARMVGYYEGADLVRQAALMAIGISQAQAFLDGNKRTAFLAMDTFLEANGHEFTGDRLELARQLEIVAERVGTRATAEEAFAAWLRERVAPRSE